MFIPLTDEIHLLQGLHEGQSSAATPPLQYSNRWSTSPLINMLVPGGGVGHWRRGGGVGGVGVEGGG